MMALDELLVALAAQVPPKTDDAEAGLRLALDSLDITLPIESQVAVGGLRASAPRGRWRSGFDLPHGELSVRFTPRAP